jgi:hypothetical protein
MRTPAHASGPSWACRRGASGSRPAAATFQTAAADLDDLNRTVAVIEGTVSLATGRLQVEARRAAGPAEPDVASAH